MRERIKSDPLLVLRKAGITPDPWQSELLQGHYDRVMLNCSRQIGKTQVTASMAVNEAVGSKSLILVLSKSERQSGEFLQRVKDLLVPFPGLIKSGDAALTVKFHNGSRIIALPCKEENIRVYSSVSLLIVDEASRVPDSLYKSVRPMLAVSKGRLVLLSTPFGKRGFFYHEWVSNNRWKRVEIQGKDCPRLGEAFLEEERLSLGDRWYRQEYCCDFAEMVGAVFASDDIQSALSDEVQPLFDSGMSWSAL